VKAQILAATILITAPAAFAQDLAPALDPVQLGQGQVLGSAVANHGRLAARRSASRRGTPAQVRACAGKERFRAAYGPDNPKVRKLYGLCGGIGW